MRKKRFRMIILNNNTPSSPSAKAKAEAAMHFTLNVQSTGTGQVSTF